MPIPYPPEYDTDEHKLQWCLAMQNKLRHRHNQAGAQYRTWLFQQPAHQKWKDFLDDWFDPRSKKLSNEITSLRQALSQKPIGEDPEEL